FSGTLDELTIYRQALSASAVAALPNSPLSTNIVVGSNPGLTLPSTTLPATTAGVVYTQTLTATGGTTPYTILSFTSFDAGTTGLSSSAVVANAGVGTFTVSGTPTGAGTLSFTVNVTDTAGATLSRSYSVVVDRATPTITWATPASVSFGSALSA